MRRFPTILRDDAHACPHYFQARAGSTCAFGAPGPTMQSVRITLPAHRFQRGASGDVHGWSFIYFP